MDWLKLTTRTVTRLGLGVAGALSGAARCGGRGTRRPSARPLPAEASEVPGSAPTAPADDGEVVTGAEDPAARAAWERFVVALENVAELRAAYAIAPDEVAAEEVLWAEVELEDAVAVAGEFEVKKIRWLLA